MAVHGHLAEKVLLLGIPHDQRPQTVPKVIERIQALRIARTLVTRLYERTPQLDGMGQHLPAELVAETEVVLRGEMLRIGRIADDVAVTAQDLPGHRVPHQELRISVRRKVLFVYIHLATRTAARLTESELPQAPYLPHDGGGLGGLDRINQVPRIVGRTQQAFFGQLFFEELPRYGFDDLFHDISL